VDFEGWCRYELLFLYERGENGGGLCKTPRRHGLMPVISLVLIPRGFRECFTNQGVARRLEYGNIVIDRTLQRMLLQRLQ
jgi:hypothetical protein